MLTSVNQIKFKLIPLASHRPVVAVLNRTPLTMFSFMSSGNRAGPNTGHEVDGLDLELDISDSNDSPVNRKAPNLASWGIFPGLFDNHRSNDEGRQSGLSMSRFVSYNWWRAR